MNDGFKLEYAKMTEVPDIQQRQQDQYEYPYHHIASIDERGEGKRIRTLSWGFEYLLYMDHLIGKIEEIRPTSILDVGCGDGYLLGHLDNKIERRVGVDVNARALSFARAFFPDVDYRNCDVADIDEVFDVVCAIEVLEHISDEGVSEFLRASYDRVRSGGYFVISVPTTNEPLNSKHFRHYDLQILQSQLNGAIQGFSVVGSEFFYKRTLVERLYQRATSNVLVQGEIPLFRGLVWRYVKRSSVRASNFDGLHLIAVLQKD